MLHSSSGRSSARLAPRARGAGRRAWLPCTLTTSTADHRHGLRSSLWSWARAWAPLMAPRVPVVVRWP